MDSKNIKYDKLEEAWTLLQGCMQDPVTSVLGDTYSNAARVQTFYMSKMLNERAANNGQMDMDKFFDNQMQIVDLYSKANKWDNTPNAKGKFVLKDEERQKNHNFYQQVAGGPRSNLIIAASNLVNSDPNRCLKFLDQFFGKVKREISKIPPLIPNPQNLSTNPSLNLLQSIANYSNLL